MSVSNTRMMRALRREPVDCTPVWIMRQAGRYLPEYRATREKAGDFLTLCKTPELACEVTLQPLARYDLDAAIVFSDILTIPDAMGLGLKFVPHAGPQFDFPIRRTSDLTRVGRVDPADQLAYVTDAIRLIKHELQDRVPLLGFAGSPWTLACYMVEGGSSKTFEIIKTLLYTDPNTLTQLLETLTVSTIDYLNAQIAAGADAVMIFDTWGGILSTPAYKAFSLRWMQQIIENLNPKVPVTLFTKQGGGWLDLIAATGCDAISLDWTVDIGQARARVGDKVALQGNLDPAILYASHDRIEQETQAILKSYGEGPGHIFNLGHGITPQVDPEKLTTLINTVHAYKHASPASPITGSSPPGGPHSSEEPPHHRVD